MLDSRRRDCAPGGRDINPALSEFDASTAGLITGNSALFPADEVRLEVEGWLSSMLSEANARVRRGRVNSATDFGEAARALAEFDFAEGREMTSLLRWIIERMEHGAVHVNHPRYFGLFNPSPTFAAQCADRIVASFNPQLATATTSPFPVALESHVIRSFASRAGMPGGSAGHFTTSGSEANATALICALTHFEPNFAEGGIHAFHGRPMLYVSREAHLAWLKIAHQTGIGRSAVRLIETDGSGRMDPEALLAAISIDLSQGNVPVMVAATAGTTGAGMIDPLFRCRDIARGCGAWFHVDAAWGGALIVSDRLRYLLAGIEYADSITIDAHKWLATTMGCGMFLTPHPEVLSSSFRAVMDCMPSNAAALDPYVTTVQWSRRFLGLRLFLGLAVAGWDGYANHVERAICLADELRKMLEAHGWRCVNESPLAVLCMVPPTGKMDPRTIAASVVESGVAWISAVDFEGVSSIRACLTSGETDENDVIALANALIQRTK